MRKFLKFGSLLGIFGGIASAQAPQIQFTISYAGLPSTPAPTTIILVAVGLLIAFVAYRKMRKLPAGGTLAAILIASGLAFVAVNATPNPIPSQSMTGAGPLVFTVNSGQEAYVVNNTGASQQITGIGVNSGIVQTPTDTPQCQVGTTLANGQGCYVVAFLPAG